MTTYATENPCAPSAAPPISVLCEDILWFVFTDVADMNEDRRPQSNTDPDYWYIMHTRALKNLRRASQVCRFWRQLILNSTVLWGRVVDMDLLQQATSDWRDEVVRRSGQSPLYIKGWFNANWFGRFFVSLLENNWDRLVLLDVFIRGSHAISTKLRSDLLQRPAKMLEFFRLELDGGCILPPPLKLFNDDAPRLQVLSFYQLSFNFQLTWLSKLQELRISQDATQFRTFDIADLLKALRQMPLLTSLILARAFTSHPSTDDKVSSRIPLPKLQQIILMDRQDVCLYVLDQIIPASGCYLYVYAHQGPSRPSLVDFNDLPRILRRYFLLYLERHTPKSLRMDMRREGCQIAVLPQRYPVAIGTFFFSMSVPPSLPPLASTDLLRLLAFPTVSSLKELTLGLQGPHFFANVPHWGLQILDFFLSLTDLERITVSSFSLRQIINTLPDNGLIFFPSLVHLTIGYMEPSNPPSLLMVELPLTKFLKWRIKQGQPIKTLDLTPCGRDLPDMRFLDSFAGLEVVWRNDENQGIHESYICGSGDPDLLEYFDLAYLDSIIESMPYDWPDWLLKIEV